MATAYTEGAGAAFAWVTVAIGIAYVGALRDGGFKRKRPKGKQNRAPHAARKRAAAKGDGGGR